LNNEEVIINQDDDFNKKNESLPPQNERRSVEPTITIHGSCNNEMDCGCKSCSEEKSPPRFIFAIGRIYYSLPNESVKRELYEAFKRYHIDRSIISQIGGERKALNQLLSGDTRRENRYIARQLCWTFNLAGRSPIYILVPSDPMDYDLLIDTLDTPEQYGIPINGAQTIDLIVGILGPVSPAGLCGPLILPMVRVDQIQTFRIEDVRTQLRDNWTESLNLDKEKFNETAEELFNRLLDMASNEGSTDEMRAFNYAALRSPTIYTDITKFIVQNNYRLENIIPKPVKVIGNTKLVEIIFYFRTTDTGGFVDMYSLEVDVSGEFPFLASPFIRYFGR